MAGAPGVTSESEGARHLRNYWTTGPGLAKWSEGPHPWTTLYHLLLQYLSDDEAKRSAAAWFEDVFHCTPTQLAQRTGGAK